MQLCDYVEAFTPFVVYNIYCSHRYESLDPSLCERDAYCSVDREDPTLPCIPSIEKVTLIAHRADYVRFSSLLVL